MERSAIYDDLEAELDRIEDILAGLDDATWLSESGAPGWTIADVVLHLAQSEEAVLASLDGKNLLEALPVVEGSTIDEIMDNAVRAQRGEPKVIFDRWRTARRDAVAGLRSTDQNERIPWAAGPLRPAALATTRLAEHWAHGLDITGPTGVAYPDTDRLQHIAWLAHRTLPYGFTLAGEEAHDVYAVLTAPSGAEWTYGDPVAESRITGDAGAFCRVGAQRLAPEESGLQASGPYGALALTVLRNYAG